MKIDRVVIKIYALILVLVLISTSVLTAAPAVVQAQAATEDFTGNKLNNTAAFKTGDSLTYEDDKLRLGMKPDGTAGGAGALYTTAQYSKVSLTADISSTQDSRGSTNRNALFIGLRVNSTKDIYSTAGSGIWFSFNNMTGAGNMYVGNTTAEGKRTSLTHSLNFGNTRQVHVIDNGSEISVFGKDDSGTEVLLAKAVVHPDKVEVYKSDGTKAADLSLTLPSKGYVGILGNFSDSYIDNVSVDDNSNSNGSQTIGAGQNSEFEGSIYERPVNILFALGILKGEDQEGFNPDSTVTRAEFASIMVRLLGLGGTGNTQNKVLFSDVNPNSESANDIELAADMGIIHGHEDGTFKPDESLTYEQAVEMIVSALGYDIYAENKGGYPGGYLITASDKKILKNVVGTTGSPATWGMVSLMAYNALEVELVQRTGFGTDKDTYSIVQGDTLLSTVFKAVKKEGLVTGVGQTGLWNVNTDLQDDEIEIDSKKYKTKIANMDNLLGRSVTYYFIDDKQSGNEIVVYAYDDNQNDIISVTSQNIGGITNEGKFIYWKDRDQDDETEEINISGRAYVVYNGKAYFGDYLKDMLLRSGDEILSGNVTLIDNNKDGNYDVVLITKYENFVVESVSMTDKKILDMYSDRLLELDPDGSNIQYNIYKDGKKITVSDLQQWDVLSVARDKNNTLMNIYVSNKVVQGKVTEIMDTNKVSIDGNEFWIADNYLDAPKSLNRRKNAKEIVLNDGGTFYLNICGEIAAVAYETTASEYSYLVKTSDPVGIEKDKFGLLIFNSNGEKLKLQSAEKVDFNGTVKKASEVLDSLRGSPQVIIYGTNGEGLVNSIKAAAFNTFSKVDLPGGTGSNGAVYRTATGRIEYQDPTGDYIVSQDTIFYSMPRRSDGTIDEDKMCVLSMPDFKYDFRPGNFRLYDVKDSTRLARVVEMDPVSAFTGFTNDCSLKFDNYYTVVDKIVSVVNEKGEKVHKLYGFSMGKPVEYTAINDEILANFEQGDIILAYRNKKGELVDAVRWADIPRTSSDGSVYDYFSGKIYDREDKIISVIADNDNSTTVLRPYFLKSPYIYKFDRTCKKISVATVNDFTLSQTGLINGSTVWMHVQDRIVRDILIVD